MFSSAASLVGLELRHLKALGRLRVNREPVRQAEFAPSGLHPSVPRGTPHQPYIQRERERCSYKFKPSSMIVSRLFVRVQWAAAGYFLALCGFVLHIFSRPGACNVEALGRILANARPVVQAEFGLAGPHQKRTPLHNVLCTMLPISRTNPT